MYWKTVSWFSIFFTWGNVGIGITNPNYLLDVDGVANFLGIRMSSGAVDGYVLTSDASGNAYWGASGWGGGGGGTGWWLTGNAGTVAGTNFVGTTTAQDLVFKRNNIEGMRLSGSSGNLITIPDSTINGLTVGRWGGNINTNTAVGYQSLLSNTTGVGNIANGFQSLAFNISWGSNTALGSAAMFSNSTGSNNTAVGYTALYYSKLSNNTAVGYASLSNTITGESNVAVGNNALQMSQWSDNIAIGSSAWQTLTTWSSNILIGANIGPNISNTGSNQLNIGNWIYGYNGDIGIGTLVPSEKLEVSGNIKAVGFYYTSDKRLKKNITPLDNSLDKILALNGYSFDWIHNGKWDIWVIAQEVEAVFPDLVKTDANTWLKSVEYANLVAPLIEAIREVDAKNKEQDKIIKELQAEIYNLKINLK
jgi:hypothetical protein